MNHLCISLYALDWWPFSSGRNESVGNTDLGNHMHIRTTNTPTIPWAAPLTNLALGVVFGPSS